MNDQKHLSAHLSKKNNGGSGKRIIGSILIEIFLTGFFLCIFALFHHVIPMMLPKVSEAVTPVQVTDVQAAPAQSVPDSEGNADVNQPEEELSSENPEGKVEEAPVIQWSELFAEYFTEEIVTTETTYTSPNVSVTVQATIGKLDGRPQRLYVADIYITDINCFRTAAAYNGFTVYSAEEPNKLDKKYDAIVMINGDYCNVQRQGLLVRNGYLYFSDPTPADICVLYYDGVMETHVAGTYDTDEILARSPYQIWRFGPALLDENGRAREEFEDTRVLQAFHPRTGLGYYEPGHYCFVVVEGRYNDTAGMDMKLFAKLFESLGCTAAYNMDGGASSVMTFNDRAITRQSSQRGLGDIIYICEPDVEFPPNN